MMHADRRMAGGLLALVIALAGALAAAARAQTNTLVIADFDGAKIEGRSGLAIWLYTDEQFGGTSEARATLIHPGADGTAGALHLAFRVTDDSRMAFAGAWAFPHPQGLTTDLSAYRGLRFTARSKDGTAFTAGIVRFDAAILRYTAPFEVKPEWTAVDLPFTTFKGMAGPPGTPPVPPMDGTKITSIGVGVAPQRRGAVELDIDRLEAYR
jgi:hypothetical protein